MNWDEPEFCEREYMAGNCTLYCLFRVGHTIPCIFADPDLIKRMAAKNDEVKTK